MKNAEALHRVDVKRQQAEAALRLSRDDLELQIVKRTGELGTSEELKRAVLDALPQHIIVIDHDGKVIESNQAWKSFVAQQDRAGSRRESYEGERYVDALRSITGFEPDSASRMETAIAAVLDGRVRSLSIELLFDGVPDDKWFLITAVPLRRDNGGMAVGHTSISEQKRSEQAAERNAEILRRLQVVTDSALSQLSFDTLIHQMLLRVCEVLKADAAALLLISDDHTALKIQASIGMNEDYETSAPVPIGEGVAGRIAADRESLLIENLEEVPVFTPLLRADFRSMIGAPLMAGSSLIGVIHAQSKTRGHFSRDDLQLLELAADRIAVAIERAQLYRTEQDLRIRAEDASRMKDEFLAVVSHELRSPLNTILGWVTLLRGGRLSSDEGKRALETIERSTRSLDRIVGDLLDVSRIITGKLKMNTRSVEPASVVYAAVEAVRPAAEAKSVDLVLNLDPTAGQVSADPDRLQQVVWNLLANAIRFTPPNGKIEVSVERLETDVAIAVTDNGRGIDREFLPYVFDRFRQADSSSTRGAGGLGLGLAIVRHLVELHGGEVTVESAGEGMGATFTVKLPRIMRRPTGRLGRLRLREVRSSHIECPPPLDGLQVLVAEKEVETREHLNAVLSECKAEVRLASSVAEAVRLLRDPEWRPEVVISDIEMPDEDGYSLIREIRELEGEGRQQIPAIALSAHARVEDRMRALRAGFQMHVAKPVEPNELLAVVASLVGRLGSWRLPKEGRDNESSRRPPV